MAQPVPPPRRDRSRSRSRHSYEGFVEKRGPRDQVGPGTEPRHPPGPSPGTHRHPPGTDPPPQSPPPPGAAPVRPPRGWFPVAEPVCPPRGRFPVAEPVCPPRGRFPVAEPVRPPRDRFPVAEPSPVPLPQGYRRVWAGLRGLTLAFYGGPRDCEPLEMLDLGELVAVRTEGGGLVLRLRGQEVTLKAESWEAQEMWRGFILTMAEMKVPTDLALLPGHLFQLSEALRDERDRRATPRVPSCFFEVTRPEAERLLERSADGGNMVLRPGGHGRGVSVTTRREVNGTVQVKHYKVNRVDQGYVIDVDTPVSDVGRSWAGPGDRDDTPPPHPRHPPEPLGRTPARAETLGLGFEGLGPPVNRTLRAWDPQGLTPKGLAPMGSDNPKAGYPRAWDPQGAVTPPPPPRQGKEPWELE
uniref:Signal transducing adaptor family member 2 n=1 Tax=Aquila chrysaetos chrysaetos TaxID=223781 RepID=A0A663FE99_AQUCH